MSKNDAQRFKDNLLDLIKQFSKLGKDSKEEELYLFNLDLFNLSLESKD